MLDLHRHDEFSSFDGFGKALDLAKLAKEQGMTALGIANHGNMNGLIEHWKACKEVGIKPVLGVEAYFQPKFDRENPIRDTFHLCLFAENLQGYKNLNRVMTAANLEQKYYKPIVDFALLEKYSEGVICTSGCIASFISQMIKQGRDIILHKALKKFIDIYGDNFYIELQPYKLDEREPDEKNLQERVNVQLVKLARQYGLKMILTSDSHYGCEHDYDTYCKMHEIKNSGDYNETYRERYMPYEGDLIERFVKLHKNDFKDARRVAHMAMDGLNEIEEKVDGSILDKLELELPRISNNSAALLKEQIKLGLQEKGKTSSKYIKQAKAEYDVIIHHGFEDYFLIVWDYVKWAREQGIKIGPGRGSVCNSLVAYALNITEVDPIYFNIKFERFMRMDKKKMPDIDLDFETERRHEVIDYIIKKYPGQAAQVCSYGLYRVDNLLNDLFKVCGVEGENNVKEQIKEYVRRYIPETGADFDYESMQQETLCKQINKEYDNILMHFSKMYKKNRFIGTHSAGVAIVGGKLLDYTSLESRGTGDAKVTSTAYDLSNLSSINVVKFDVLGLRTLSVTKELEEATGECFSYSWLEDKRLYEYFSQGKTDGIFQFEKNTPKNILIDIKADSMADVMAAAALNRPGPLSMRMPAHYAASKESGDYGSESWSEYTNETYGTVVYQEQVQAICTEIGLLTYNEADRILDFMKAMYMFGAQKRERDTEIVIFKAKFIDGAKQTRGMSAEEAGELFDRMTVYTFNKGHTTGYSMISVEQMYYKVYHPELFWLTTLKYAIEVDIPRLEVQAVQDGNVILLPHVNYGASFSLVKVQGSSAIAEGLSTIKNVGDKAAAAIEAERRKNGKYTDYDNFLDRVPGRVVNTRVVKALEENGALIFDKTLYFERVKKYNSTMFMKGVRGNGSKNK